MSQLQRKFHFAKVSLENFQFLLRLLQDSKTQHTDKIQKNY